MFFGAITLKPAAASFSDDSDYNAECGLTRYRKLVQLLNAAFGDV